MSAIRARAAIQHVAETGNLEEGKAIALGNLPFLHEGEEIGNGAEGAQSWFLPDEDKVNRAILLCRDKLGVEPTVEPYEVPGGNVAGYKITVSGQTDETLSNLFGVFGGAHPISGASLPGDSASA